MSDILIKCDGMRDDFYVKKNSKIPNFLMPTEILCSHRFLLFISTLFY